MSRKPLIKLFFFPGSILLFCAASLFWQFNPIAQASTQYVGKNIRSNEANFYGVTTTRSEKAAANMAAAKITANKTGKAADSTKLISPKRRLAKKPHKKKIRHAQTGSKAKKDFAEIEIIETEDPHNWSNLSSFLRNTSAVNLRLSDSPAPFIYGARAAENRIGSSKVN